MIKIDLNNIPIFLFQIHISNERIGFDWQCQTCGEIHHETEARNFFRRQIKCNCQQREKQVMHVNEVLKNKYLFLHNEENAYTLTKTKKIDLAKPILVQCIRCNNISYEYFHNIASGHKKCNCDIDKQFTRNLSTQDFIAKWDPINKQNFTLISTEQYINRNTKYKVKCNYCGKEDTRWGITLIDEPTNCKYCSTGSIGEKLVGSILDNYQIDYIREYSITYKDHLYRFDFYLPKYNTFIEYNGRQHYDAIPFFGGEERLKIQKNNDKVKQEYCKNNHQQLIIIPYYYNKAQIEQCLGLMFNDYPVQEQEISD